MPVVDNNACFPGHENVLFHAVHLHTEFDHEVRQIIEIIEKLMAIHAHSEVLHYWIQCLEEANNSNLRKTFSIKFQYTWDLHKKSRFIH